MSQCDDTLHSRGQERILNHSVGLFRRWNEEVDTGFSDRRAQRRGKNRGVVRLWLEGFTVTQARKWEFFVDMQNRPCLSYIRQSIYRQGYEELSLAGNTRRNL